MFCCKRDEEQNELRGPAFDSGTPSKYLKHIFLKNFYIVLMSVNLFV
jgi:hypothetical protein